MTRARLIALVVPSILLLAACGPSEERASDVAVHEAIARVRDHTGPPEGRRVKLAALERLAAATPAGSAAKLACARAYESLTTAEEAIFFAKARMAQAKGPAVMHTGAVAEVAAAEAELAKARADMPACDAAAAELALVAR